MGRRNNDKLTAGQEKAAERTMHALLQRHDQPTALASPPDLASRIAQRLPAVPPAEAARTERRHMVRGRVAAWGSLLVLFLLSIIGAWGVLVDSNAPALLFGGPETTLGHATLVLTLASKPIIARIISLDATLLLLGVALTLAAGWLWWKLLAPPAALLGTESHL